MTAAERFARKTRVTETGCIEWTGALSRHSKVAGIGGYGMFRDGSKIVYAHRYALAQKLGRPIRDGYEADHQCHNRACVNQDHLRELLKAENIREANARRYAAA